MSGRTPDGTVFEAEGQAGAPAVVLIHGLGLNRASWRWTRPALTDRYRVFSYDLYGHGESGSPPGEPSLGLFSRQLRLLMEHCGVARVAIVGFSLGGMIARRFAWDVPERTAALALLHSPHRRTGEAQAALRARVELAKTAGPSATVDAALERWFTDGFRVANQEMMNLVRKWITANDIAIYHRNYAVLIDGMEEIVAPCPPISCPALVLTGDEDFGNGPEMTRAIAAEIAGAETVILPGLRHMALAERPDAVNAPLRAFLDRVIGEAGR